jgi:fatty-acyl-CoA synthase
VVGRPSDRFGSVVVAVVQLRQGAPVTPSDLGVFSSRSLARFTAPRAVAVCDQVVRLANGTADYLWARSVALDAVDATTPAPGTRQPGR